MAPNSNTTMMAEAEGAVLLAIHLFEQKGASEVHVALDGAQVMIRGQIMFPVEKYLGERGWKLEKAEGTRPWNGHYVKDGKRLHIHARSGQGDVVAVVGNRRYYAECKKGPMTTTRRNPEYGLLREAIGQLMTIKEVKTGDMLIAAVPQSQKFRTLTAAWQALPAIRRAKINFVCVGRDGSVEWMGE